MKPTLLARQLLEKRFALEVKVDANDQLRREIGKVRKAIRSPALCQAFLVVASGTGGPTEIARRLEKSKFTVSLQLSELAAAGLLRQHNVFGKDRRRKRYNVAWERFGKFFHQDHALELEIYENHLLAEPLTEFHGTMVRTELAILGNGKLGLVKEVVPENLPRLPDNSEHVTERMNRLIWEFVEVFKISVNERRYGTIREYLLGAYKELAESYRRIPRSSELARFYKFLDESFARIRPIEELWKRYALRRPRQIPRYFMQTPQSFTNVKLFAEAGSTDHTGRYVLNAEAQVAIKPGTRLRIYPSYTYTES